jgi:hypothetical protein
VLPITGIGIVVVVVVVVVVVGRIIPITITTTSPDFLPPEIGIRSTLLKRRVRQRATRTRK